MYELLKGNVDYRMLTRPAHVEYHRIFDTVQETGAHHFLHGVAVEQWQGRLAACFAFNGKEENTVTEQLYVTWSADNGKSWTKAEPIAPPAFHANSHSVFLAKEDALWCFGPHFMGLGERTYTKKDRWTLHFVELQMEAWSWNGEGWQSHGIVADDFWPLGEPTRMDNGCWLIAGCDTHWMGAVAISHGDDLMHWDIVKPDTDEEVLTEAGAWVNGNEVMMVLRNQSLLTDGKYYAHVARSTDYGKTFTPCEITNLPISTTKPFCGYLADGRPYLIFNESIDGDPTGRSRLLMGIGQKGTFTIDHMVVVDEGYRGIECERMRLSYPYAKQIGSNLYVAYSYESAPGTGHNHNDAMLAIIDVNSLD